MTLVAGIDVGSTGIKVLVARADDPEREVLREQVPTPWTTSGDATDLDSSALRAALERLLVRADERLRERGERVSAIATTGMGESGFLVGPSGAPLAPAPAWFDPRGREELALVPAGIADEFAGRTGIPLGVQVTTTKIALRRAEGVPLAGARFSSVPEWAARLLGADLVAERSLLGRTGLIDQDTGAAWPEMLEHLGADETLLPPVVAAGVPAGRADAAWVPDAFRGAVVTVAGHDHLVAAASAGLAADRYDVSFGTAEVLLRVLETPLDRPARARLAAHLIDVVPHVVPGRWALVAGVKTGLLLRRALRMFGIADAAARDALDAEVMALPDELPAVETSGARNDDGSLRLAILSDGVSPAAVFESILRHSNDEIRLLVQAIDRELPSATSSRLTGGWSSLRSVRRARSAVLPDLRVSDREQDTAYGAVLLARDALAPTAPPTSHRRRQMNTLTTLERRALSRLTTPAGGMLIVAADQRNSMKKVMTDDPQSVDRAGLAAAKADLVRHLGNRAPAILLDPETALPDIVDDAVLAPETGLVVALDQSGYAETEDGLRRTRFIDGMSPRRVRDLGGDAAKMLFYLRPDRGAAEDEVVAAIGDLARAADAEGVLLIVEILTYRLPGESDEEYAAAFPGLIEEATRLCVAQGVKVLKIPYPGSADASRAVHRAAEGVPWAVLSAGVDHATFVEQVRTAVRHGSAGAMAGRSLWKDCLSTSSEERERRLTEVAAVRAAELASVIDEELAARDRSAAPR